jgi:hypothetical protein
MGEKLYNIASWLLFTKKQTNFYDPKSGWGAQKLAGEILKVVWAEFST